MNISNSFVIEQLEKQNKNLMNTAVLLGSANLPFPEIHAINAYLLDYNAAEGKRFQRIFPGCQELDTIEAYGEECLKELFHIPNHFKFSFNPLSGTQANQIVYNAMLKPDSIILSLSLRSGGHMSHIDYLKKYYQVIEYHFSEEKEGLDYNEIEYLCEKYHPELLIAGASSYPLLIRYDLIGEICKKNKCLLLADISHTALYIMENLQPNPFEWADFITFTTHKTTRGPRGAILAYNCKYEPQIDFSIFPVSQGAPIFSQICAKVIMLETLLKQNRGEYCNRIFHLTDLFIKELKKNGIPLWIGRTDTHLCIADLHKYNSFTSADEFQKLFEESGIYVNTCYLPSDNAIPNGIRFGLMMLATLDINDTDLKLLSNLIVKIIQSKKTISNKCVSEIMSPYYINYWRKYYE